MNLDFYLLIKKLYWTTPQKLEYKSKIFRMDLYGKV